MLLRLEMDYTDEIGHPVHKGSILKWYKREGEWVDYGDDLFEMKVDEVLVPASKMDRIALLRELDSRPSQLAEMATDSGVSTLGLTDPAADAGPLSLTQWVSVIRVKASGQGFLRRVYTKSSLNSGDLLAALTTSETDKLETAQARIQAAPPFRVTTSVEADPSASLIQFAEATVEGPSIGQEYAGLNYLMFCSKEQRERRIGIYALGSCDLNTLFACKPLIQEVLQGTCCIFHEGSVADARSDVILQTLQDFPDEWLSPVRSRLREWIPTDYFKPRLFESTFLAAGPCGLEEFPKDLVALSTGADLTRTIYRERENGFLIDPGGRWLNESIADFLADLPAVNWFRENFDSIGKISPENFLDNFEKVLRTLKERTSAQVIVFNQPTIESNYLTHNYQFVRNSQAVRRMEFNLALVELSRKLDFSIVDVDRILTKAGIHNQVDWDHPHPAISRLIGQEAFGIMREREVF